jgi:alpha/beta superfamily hydrolase
MKLAKYLFYYATLILNFFWTFQRKGKFGGSMHNNVISSIFDHLIKNNISCLRFNFRGVEGSTGHYSGGIGELSDVHSCIKFLQKKENRKILICGYSYGAAIGCSAVNFSESIIGFCAISFPWDFMGKNFGDFSQTDKFKLFIQGDQDSIAQYDNFLSHYKKFHEPKEKIIIEGADHFYRGLEGILAEDLVRFIKKIQTI